MKNDRFTIRGVIVILGLVAVGALLAGSVLAYQGKPIPDFIVATLGAAVGAVGSLLAKTSLDSTQDVQVVNEPGDPVPVDPA